MKVIRGKVVGNTVVLEESLPEGLEVEVLVGDAGEAALHLTDEMEKDLADALEEARRGEGTSAQEYFARLPPYEAPR